MARAGPIPALFTFYAEIVRHEKRRTVTLSYFHSIQHLPSNSFLLKVICIIVLLYNIYVILDNEIMLLSDCDIWRLTRKQI